MIFVLRNYSLNIIQTKQNMNMRLLCLSKKTLALLRLYMIYEVVFDVSIEL